MINNLTDAIIYTDDEPLINFKLSDEDYILPSSPSSALVQESQKKKKKRKTTKSTNSETTEVVTTKPEESDILSQLPVCYKDEFNYTTQLLQGTINQIDMHTANIENDLSIVRSKNTLSKKYDYISTMVGSVSGLISTKVNAIREMNNSIKTANDMEFKRIKELKSDKTAELTDDKLVQDLYRNMITQQSQGMTENIGTMLFQQNQGYNEIVTDYTMNDQYNEYLNSLTPEQNLMMLEGNNNIEEVVCYDSNTGAAWFDIIDRSTGQPVQNVPKKSQMFMENTTLDLGEMTARNSKLGESYRIVLVGNNSSNYISEY